MQVDGGGLEADRCVIAVPATVIDELDFDPPLPTRHREALAGIAYGHAAKLFVPIRGDAAPGAVLSVPERYWAWTATGAKGRVQPVVSAFAGSPPALERFRVADGPERWLASLATLRPDLELDPGWRHSLHLERRPVGRRGLLGEAPGGGHGDSRAAARSARFRGGAHRRGLRVLDGRRAAKRSAGRATTHLKSHLQVAPSAPPKSYRPFSSRQMSVSRKADGDGSGAGVQGIAVASAISPSPFAARPPVAPPSSRVSRWAR